VTDESNVFVGFQAGQDNTTGGNNTFVGRAAGFSNNTGSNNTTIGSAANVVFGDLTFATAIGAGATVSASNTIALGRSSGADKVVVYGLGTAGGIPLCHNGSRQIADCSSSLRYKSDVQPFVGGLSLIHRLRPITFLWKDGGMKDIGFAAEEVEKVEPLLTFRNAKGEIEGVKYAQIIAALVNAIKEQQTQIHSQQEQLRERERQAAAQQTRLAQYESQLQRQQQEIDALKQLVCASHPQAEVCRTAQRKP
jgi:hypothetical protein